MSTRNDKNQKDYSQPTLEKNGELALFYNIAYNRLSDLIFNLEGKKGSDQIKARLFSDSNCEDIQNSHNHKKIKDLKNRVFKDKTYAYIKAFILKDNTGNLFVLEKEIELINKIILTLYHIRNFQSHWYHADTRFIDRDVKKFLDVKLEIAKAVYNDRSEKLSHPFELFTNETINNHTNYKLTDKGINFFLSFFLPKAYMNLFMSQREFLKRNDNADDYDYKYHRFLCTFYCLKDGFVNQHFVKLKDDSNNFFKNVNIEEYLSKQIESHLEAYPKFLMPFLEKSKLETITEKNETLFLKYIATFLNIKGINFQWEIISQKKSETENSKPQNKFRGEKNYKNVPDFTTKIQADTQLKVKGNQIRFRFDLDNGEIAQCFISKNELMVFAYLLLYDKNPINKFKEFAYGSVQLIKNINDNKTINHNWVDKNIRFVHPILVKFINDNKKLEEDEWKKTLTQKIKNKIENYYLNTAPKVGLLYSENYLSLKNTNTLLFETSEKIKNQLADKNRSDFTEEEKIQYIEWITERKKLKAIRHKKLKQLLFFKDIIMEKNGRFMSVEDLKNFSRFVYRKDDDDPIAEKEILIEKWIEHRKEVFIRKKQLAVKRFQDLNALIAKDTKIELNRFLNGFSLEIKLHDKKSEFKNFISILISNNKNFNTINELLDFVKNENKLKDFISKYKLDRNKFANYIERLFTAKEIDQWYNKFIELLKNETLNFDGLFIEAEKLFIEKCKDILKDIDKQSLSKLQFLSKLLQIENENLKQSRNAFANRTQEIIQPFIATEKEDNETKNIYIFSIPNKFFSSDDILRKEYQNSINFIKNQREKWKANADIKFHYYFTHKIDDNKEEKEIYNIKNKIHLALLEDNLLHKIFAKLNENNLGKWQLVDKKMFEWIDNSTKICITANMRDLKNNSSLISADRIEKILQRVQIEDQNRNDEDKLIKNNTIDYQVLKQQLINYWFDSREFLSEIFKIEKEVVTTIQMPPYNPTKIGYINIKHVKFDKTEKAINRLEVIRKDRILEILGFRNTTYHADVLVKDKKGNFIVFKEVLNELKDLVKIIDFSKN